MTPYQRALQFQAFTHFFLDPGSNVSGYAAYEHSRNGRRLKSTGFIDVKTKDGEDFLDKLRTITDLVLSKLCSFHRPWVWVEIPPFTLYEQKRSSKDMLIARAQSVFKTVGVAYSVLSVTRLDKNVAQTRAILPSQWQGGKRRENSKVWSMRMANQIVTGFNLSSHRDQNLADAITMGYVTLDNLENGTIS